MAQHDPAPYIPQIRLYQDWLHQQRGLQFADYDALHQWSVTDLSGFWQSIWDYFALRSPTPHSTVLGAAQMPGAQWFPGAQVNYARQVFRHADAAQAAGCPAIVSHDETSLASDAPARTLSWPALRQQVASLALHLRAQGLQPGDRVAAYLPNIPEAMVAFLAVVSLGGIWSICAPDMGTAAVLDRFKQIEPVVLIAADSVTYGGRVQSRSDVIAELRAGLPSVRHVILHSSHDAYDTPVTPENPELIAPQAVFTKATARNDAQTDAFEPLWLPFDHPLWIVYSSGTTGLPKPIVHGHGGTLVVAMAQLVLHHDIGSSYAANSRGERFHWYSSTGWVMWNAQLSGLLGGTTCVIFDGNPGGTKDAPDWTTLWRFAAQTGVTFFGAGAAFYANCMKAGVDLSALPGLDTIRALGSTGSPLSEDAQRWGTNQFARIRAAMPELLGKQGPRDWLCQTAGAAAPSGGRELHEVNDRGGAGPIWWNNISGGTDFAGAFIGGNRELPATLGAMQCRLLGCAVEAWNEAGQPARGEVGELVCTQPIPSMPLYFWGDTGNARYLSSYFDTYPGDEGGTGRGAVWRHGDWLTITASGSCIIYGRSDATINRHGLRMGTSELYSAIEALPEVLDSLVVDLEYLGKDSYMPLFVKLRPGLLLGDDLTARLSHAIKTALSPRFVPNAIFQVPDIPRTLSGKKQELPIKKLLLGQPLEKVVNKDAMANPESLEWFVGFARQHLAKAT